jgi:uncharacterized membrane protein YgaE (UPF0421/DUF939 family)
MAMQNREATVSGASSYGASAYLSDSLLFDWKQASFQTDLVFVIAIAVCLTVGIAAGSPRAGMIATSGAFTVGLGAKQRIDGSRLVPMMFAAFSMTVSTFAGMVTGHTHYLVVVVVALWAFIYGMWLNRQPGYAWVSQQAVIFLLIATAFPFSPKAAALRALLVFAGGTLQILITSAMLQIFGKLRLHLSELASYAQKEEQAIREALRHMAHSVKKRSFEHSPVPFALRVSLVLALGTIIYQRTHFVSGYWIPMTSLLVLKPGVYDTMNRAIARVLGTIVGAALLTVLLAHISPTPPILALFAVLFAWLAYSTLYVNYMLFTVCLTSYIVFLLALNKLPQAEIARQRAICTIIGGGLALVMRLIVLARRKKVEEQEEAEKISETSLRGSGLNGTGISGAGG